MSDRLSIAENSLIAVFARKIADGAPTLMTVGELKSQSGLSESESRQGIEALSARGWLFIASTMNWDDQTECILLGPGNEAAQKKAADIKRQPLPE